MSDANTQKELKKQVSLFLPLSRYRALRNEAARQKRPMTDLVREWIAPHIESLVEADRGGSAG